jgi:type II secretory pathway component GspD/PulD (secretin)
MLAIAIATSAISATPTRQSIQKVEISNLNDSVVITINTTSKPSLKTSRLGKYCLVFDLLGHLKPDQKKAVAINSGGITTVKCGWFKDSPPTARIVVSSTRPCNYSISYQNNGRQTVIKVSKPVTTKSPNPKSTVPMKSNITTSAPTTDKLEPIVANNLQPLSDLSKVVTKPLEITHQPVLVASTVPIATSKTKQTSLPTPSSKLISLDFVASDIHDVLKALAVQSGENVIAGPDVKGNITVSLNKVTVEEALKLVCNISGYQYIKTDSSYVVGTPATLKTITTNADPTDEKVTEVVLVQASDPAVVSKVLQSQFSTVQVSTGSESPKQGATKGPTMLILSGPATDVQNAKAAVNAIEKSYAQSTESLLVEVYEVKYAEISELPALLMDSVPGLKVITGPSQGFNMVCPSAVEISSESGLGSNYKETTDKQKPSPNVLILQGSREAIDKAKNLLAQLDVPQPQIIIEAKVMDITDTGAKDLGIDWGGEFGTLTTFSLTEDTSLTEHSWQVGRMDRSPINLAARLKGIIQSGKGRVLANPNVLALDGKPASIFIGDEIKYVTRVDASENGQTVVTTETARVGVQLHCISRINSDGYITMNLHPEVSVIVDWKELRDVSLALPQISRRFVDSTVRIKDGDTIVIGGLIKDEEIKNMSGIPFLKDLPILGSLFRYDTKSKTHSEVMVFITPKIVKTNQ